MSNQVAVMDMNAFAMVELDPALESARQVLSLKVKSTTSIATYLAWAPTVFMNSLVLSVTLTLPSKLLTPPTHVLQRAAQVKYPISLVILQPLHVVLMPLLYSSAYF